MWCAISQFLNKLLTFNICRLFVNYVIIFLYSGPMPVTEFKADIHKKWKEKSEEQKSRELVRQKMSLTSKKRYLVFVL